MAENETILRGICEYLSQFFFAVLNDKDLSNPPYIYVSHGQMKVRNDPATVSWEDNKILCRWNTTLASNKFSRSQSDIKMFFEPSDPKFLDELKEFLINGTVWRDEWIETEAEDDER